MEGGTVESIPASLPTRTGALSDATPLDRPTDKAWTRRTADGTRATLPAAGFGKGLRGIVEDH
jgi:hypothetical protein